MKNPAPSARPDLGCKRPALTAEARIVRPDAKRHDEGATLYYPVATWTTRDGREVEGSSRSGRGSITSNFGVGSAVTVRYDPTDPRWFAIHGWDVTTVDLVFALVGSLLTAGTLLVLLVRLLTL
ncbi:DUF3592 domain-containing protein [Streptomyces sp. NPDC092903]|uniref:DUF3592 domain-containing protein n=1 Tax=Streptomyces sp. NPDC092903 TaxID=3366017 RepID=UPI00382B9216